MSKNPSTNFLPTVFQSPTNKKFFGATLDQLTTDANDIPLNGYIGRTFAPTYKQGDNYIPEPTATRRNYQLEPGVVIKDNNGNIEFTTDYIDLLNNIANNNGFANNHQRLFENQAYSYDGHFDYDKFVRYYDYYWLPNGPMDADGNPTSVAVYANQTPYQANYTVSRNTNINGYTFSGVGNHPNLPLTLARGGTYTFAVSQPGYNFWLQTESGVSGTNKNIATVSTRQVFGVRNNGTDNGTITFQVPLANAQDFYSQMKFALNASNVSAAVEFNYTDIQNQLLSTFLTNFPQGLDGITSQLNNKTFVFVNNASDATFWTTPAIPNGISNTITINPGTVINSTTRTNAWKIALVPTSNGDSLIQISPSAAPTPSTKVFITSGNTYASNEFWVNNNYQFQQVPAITANLDYLYYQDSSNPDFVGVIKLVDNQSSTIDVNNDILGKVGYTSPNGVIATNGLKIKFDSYITPSSYANKEYYIEGVGASITLTAVTDLVIPESYGDDIETTPDYITINRGSQDLNPWTRYNRWFHKDVILATAKYNNTSANYGSGLVARRPIIEFEPNLQLFNFGNQVLPGINIVSFDATDAFVNVEGQITATIDGTTVTNGQTVLFTNDYDTNVTNHIYQIQIQNILSKNYIVLVDTGITPEAGMTVTPTTGNHAGITYYFNGTSWLPTQTKTKVNQPPLFDIVDANGYSFSDSTVYPGTNFVGTYFFGYSGYNSNTSLNDTILGFTLTYQNFNNIGDIVFSNYYDTDTFTTTSGTVNINTGYLVQNNNGTAVKLNDWVENINPTEQYQQFTKFYDGRVISVNGVETAFVQIDVLPKAQQTIPYCKVYLNNSLLTINVDYQIIQYGVYNVVALSALPKINDKIDVLVFSDVPGLTRFYQIPDNLNLNPLNQNFGSITLGQIRTHYNKLIENTSVNSIPVQDNNLKQQGGTIIQHQAPLIYSMAFLNNSTANFVDSISLARKEYTKFKNKFLSLCNSLRGLNYNDSIGSVDTILQNINAIKNSSFPWYYSDMVPQGSDFTSITYTVVNARQTNYEINSIFNNAELSNRAVLVWVNGVQRTLGTDYTFSQLVPAIIFSIPFSVGDTILIRDYSNTDGNYIPETPTKLGLYPKFTPSIYVDNTYQTPISVIQGHDGSITPAFGDFRDQLLLELELRIYNNIKADYSKNQINLSDFVPGRFKTTDYSLQEYNQILGQSFLAWVGANKVDYTTNSYYDANNPWTWNYSKFPDVVDNSFLQGNWRAIYNYWFDTDTPNLTPWRMLGFSSMPSWWETRYGPAPYTSGNTLLWSDLEAGYIWNNGTPGTNTKFARPGLTGFIPVDSIGNLLSPADIPLFSKANYANASNSYAPGQQGPVETAWRRSSDYAYGVQLALAIAKPAMYFSTQLDTSSFYSNPVTGQFGTISNEKITPAILKINGNTASGTTQRTSGYINWIGDNIKNLGMNPVTILTEYFTNLSVQLTYKLAGFTSQNLLTVYAEQTTPGSTNSSVIIPSENWNVYLNKSIPIQNAEYSAVVVTKTESGYSVSGYSPTNPFFTIIPSLVNNNTETVTVNQTSITLYNEHVNAVAKIPYGTIFTLQQTADFLISYQRYLTRAGGFVFDTFNTDLGTTQDWKLSVRELIYWAQQGWGSGTVIVLNPVSTTLKMVSVQSTVDEVTNVANGNKLLDQNFLPIKSNNFDIQRLQSAGIANEFVVSTIDGTGIAYAKLNLVQFEHVLVFDNVDDFGDILYIPESGTRQYRLKLSGSKTGDWNGALSAPGYVYNDPAIASWFSGTDYRTGDIVTYNGFYYTTTQDIPATQTFNPISWTQINQSNIQTGLLPNFGHNAQKFINIYDVDKPPLEEDLQLYSAGLIGFRERSYLTDLGLSIPTQTKFYQGFIKQKGTMNSVNALTKAQFDNVQGNVNVYEEWAFQVGRYGGINSNIFKEFILDQSVFTTNPVSFLLTNTYSTANIIANLTLANIYNASNLSSTSTTIYNNRTVDQYATDLPDVGYVNLQDADHLIFDIAEYQDNVASISIGDKIWLAKNYLGQWDILRAGSTKLVATKVTYILDTNAQLYLNGPHSFVAGDLMVVKNFGNGIDNIYQIVSVPNSTSVIISINNANVLKHLIRVLSLNGNGIIYSLNSARYSTVSSLVSATIPVNGWLSNDHVWIDSATTNGWGVYTFNNPWAGNSVVKSSAFLGNVSNNKYGTSVKINNTTGVVYVGNPGAKQVQALTMVNGSYQASQVITNSGTSFGTSIDSSGNILVVSAPVSGNVNVYFNGNTTSLVQTIKGAGNFGNSVALSGDQHYLYVGTPGANTANVYFAQNPSWANVTYSYVTTISGVSGAFGSVIKTNNNGSQVFISAPTATNGNTQAGNVYVYSRTANAFTLAQTLTSLHNNQGAQFGTGFAVDGTGGNLFVGVPGSTASGFQNGVVERWINSSGTYTRTQVIAHPYMDTGENFGASIGVSSDAQVLSVGSVGSPAEEFTTFDNLALVIDSSTTKFIDYIANSGAVYMFESLIDTSIGNNIGTYLFSQELETSLSSNDNFGYSVDVTRSVAVAGAPGSLNNAGLAYVFSNPSQETAWTLTRKQTPQVDINSISRTFLYNKVNNTILAALDFIDPAKGKVLSQFDNDIDFKLENDPARYNHGTGTLFPDLHWGPSQVGAIWWDLSAIRFIDYEQDSLIYRLNNWGAQFPGSQVSIYQWIESTVLPSKYVASGLPGTPMVQDDSAYSTYGYVTASGAVHLKYYFWVSGIDTIAPGKSNSVLSIAEGINNPQSQGIPYATVLRNDAIALYNVKGLLVGQSTVLQLGSKAPEPIVIHNEYALVQEGNPSSEIPTQILNKLIDSLSGIDAKGNSVPDTSLIPSQRYGIGNRPIQTMFINPTLALANYLSLVNNYLMNYPIVERKSLTLLNSQQPVPAAGSGAYSLVVNTLDDLGYIENGNLTTGQRVLVLSDSSQMGKWAIYSFIAQTNTGVLSTDWSLISTQSYKTSLYWNYIDWYDSNYDPTTTPNLTVANLLELGKQTLVANTYAKVLNAGNNNFVVYYIDSNLNKNLVGIQNGTIQISTGTIPNLELRQILLAMQTDIFVNDLSAEYNTIFFAMVKYILTEQKNLDWVFKTSFISATQAIRKLEEFPSYVPDNQNFYLDYINEVKPYRTIVREFVVDYVGNDSYSGDITDFDLPPYWDATLGVYRSPTGTQPYDATILQSGVYAQWKDNYGYGVVDVVIGNPGSGFVFAPLVIITGGGGIGATGIANLNSTGGIKSITMLTPGQGYTSTPTIILNGTGSGVIAYPVLRNVFTDNNTGHNVVRSLSTTMKFDRIDYTNSNTFVFWNTITSANVGNVLTANTIVVNNNIFYQLTNNFTITSNLAFPTSANVISSSSFNTANDRIVAYNGNIDLSISQPNLVYSGVIVDGNTYTSSNYDTIISSAYTDALGVAPGDITIDGGRYYDTFNSHAPEEMIPGRVFDSIDIEVYDSAGIAFRLFDDMNQNHNFYRIGQNQTTLSNDLLLTDQFIQVTDASKLPQPDITLAIPGVIFINGEKITYYRNFAYETPIPWTPNTIITSSSVISYANLLYLTNGNVFANSFANIASNVASITANTLGQIRRAVDGTAPSSTNITNWQQYTNYPTDSYVYYNGTTYATRGNTYGFNQSWSPNNANIAISSYLTYAGNIYTVTGNVYGNTFAGIQSNLSLVRSGTDSGFASITGNLIFAFTGNNAVRHVAGTEVVDASRTQIIPGTSTSNNQLRYSQTFTSTQYVTYGLKLVQPITANIGDVLTQVQTIKTSWQPNTAYSVGTLLTDNSTGPTYTWLTIGNVYGSYFANITSNVVYQFAGNTNNTVTVRALQSVTNSNVIPVIITAGTVANLPEVFDSSLGFDANGDDGNLCIVSSTTPTIRPNVVIPTWTANTTFTVESIIQYNSNVYTVLSNVYAPYFANVTSQSNNSANLTISANANVAFNGPLANYTSAATSLQVNDQWLNTTTNTLYYWTGSSWALLVPVTLGVGFDSTSSPLYINGNVTQNYIVDTYIIGSVDNNGQVTVPAGTYVTNGNIWYSSGSTTASNGIALSQQSTQQALFLKASEGAYQP